MAYEIISNEVIDTTTGCGGSLRLKISNDITGEIRTYEMDLQMLFLAARSGRVRIRNIPEGKHFRIPQSDAIYCVIKKGEIDTEVRLANPRKGAFVITKLLSSNEHVYPANFSKEHYLG